MSNVTSTSSPNPAQIYDDLFVPALFEPWSVRVAELAAIERGHVVLDVGCGTGVLAVAAAARVGVDGRVIGLDANPEMLAVARSKDVRIAWRDGRAEHLPFEDGTFDRVVSQFACMFFEDGPLAVREMARVLRPGGRLVVAVCDAVDHSPGYAVLTELLHRLFGAKVAGAFRAPFVLGDRERLHSMAREAGLTTYHVARHDGTVAFPSIEAMVSAERACAWTLGGLLDDHQFARLLDAAEESLAPFAAHDGAVTFGMPVLCLTAEASASA